MSEEEIQEKGFIEEVLEANDGESDQAEEVEEEYEEIETEDRRDGGTVSASTEASQFDPTGVIADSLEALGKGYTHQQTELQELKEDNEKLKKIIRSQGFKV